MGVSDRVVFLRRTYGLLGLSLIAFAAITGGMMRFATETSLGIWAWAGSDLWHIFVVFGLFLLVGHISRRLAVSETSRALQYLGLVLGVALYSVLLQPILWTLFALFGDQELLRQGVLFSGEALAILSQAIVITLAIFVGLTLTVFVTRKDFSFLRGGLSIASFALLGVIIASWLFGFSLGALFCGAVILLMAGYILYETSLVMSYFPPTGYVAAALMLFSTVATLFIYVLRILMELNRR